MGLKKRQVNSSGNIASSGYIKTINDTSNLTDILTTSNKLKDKETLKTEKLVVIKVVQHILQLELEVLLEFKTT